MQKELKTTKLVLKRELFSHILRTHVNLSEKVQFAFLEKFKFK